VTTRPSPVRRAEEALIPIARAEAGYPCTKMIPARLNVVTLGVTDLDRQRAFYRALGWEGAIEAEDFCAFWLDGLYLGLFPWEKLAADG
jgi:hypothetical protein